MTVSMQLTKRIYAGNGITRQWEVDFPLYAADNLQVFITSPQGVQTQVTTGYALNVTNDMLTYPVEESGQEPLASGWTITLVRNTPPTQQIDLLRQGELDAEVLEQGYDKLTLIAQELSEKIDRCIKYPVSTQPGALDTDTFFNDVMSAKQSAVTASAEAAIAANTASASAAIATSTAQQAVSDIAMAKQNATGAISAQTQTACQQVEQSTAEAVSAAQTAQYYAEHTLGKFVGEVYYSQSSSAQDNPGALPLFTGETISNAEQLYPDFYTWVANHSALQISAADYETALTTYGECPKYVIDTTNKTIRLPKLTNYVKMANTTDGITQSGAVPSGAGAGNSSQGGATPAHTTLYPWVCAYNAAIPASTAQAAQFQQALTGKADTNLSNVTGTSGFRKLVEVYSNGASWYKVFDEYDPVTGAFIGQWCEQGGSEEFTNYSTTVSLLKTYADTNYTLITAPYGWSNTPSQWIAGGVKSTNQFTIVSTTSLAMTAAWRTEGYLAIQ